MKSMVGVVFALSTLLLAGCATSAERAQRTQAHMTAVEAAAGQPVDSFLYGIHTMYSWQPLGENQVLVYTTPTRAWLLSLDLCPELPYATAIGITSHGGRVNRLIDSVRVNGSMAPCTIEQIRPVDLKKVHAPVKPRAGAKLVRK